MNSADAGHPHSASRNDRVISFFGAAVYDSISWVTCLAHDVVLHLAARVLAAMSSWCLVHAKPHPDLAFFHTYPDAWKYTSANNTMHKRIWKNSKRIQLVMTGTCLPLI
jgi:hypothetical protein